MQRTALHAAADANVSRTRQVPIIVRSPFDNYLPRWSVFDRQALIPRQALGCVGETGDVRRFAARYRAARSFKAATFEGLTHDTADGYSALCLLLLTYSAFEYFRRAIGLEMRHTSALLADDEREQVQKHVMVGLFPEAGLPLQPTSGVKSEVE
jgi:hypothetical protein